MATTRETNGEGSGKPRSREELEEFLKSPAIHALIKESRAQVERGEYISVPIPEIKRRLRLGD